METVNPGKMVAEDSLIRILAYNQELRDECLVDIEDLTWVDDGYGVGCLSLESIEHQLFNLGYRPVIYVWVETPLEGVIYEFGNYSTNFGWAIHGHTKGYA